MSQTKSDDIIAELKQLTRGTPDHLWDLMGDVQIGRMNGEIAKEVPSQADTTSDWIALFSAKAILGIFDQEDLTEAFRDIGVQRPERWAEKMMTYIKLHR